MRKHLGRLTRKVLRKEAPEKEGWNLYEDQPGCRVYEDVFRTKVSIDLTPGNMPQVACLMVPGHMHEELRWLHIR